MNWDAAIKAISPHVVRIETPSGYGTGFLSFYNHDGAWAVLQPQPTWSVMPMSGKSPSKYAMKPLQIHDFRARNQLRHSTIGHQNDTKDSGVLPQHAQGEHHSGAAAVT
jgi:hypothetical protein